MKNKVERRRAWYNFPHRWFILFSLLPVLFLWGISYMWPVVYGLCLSFTKYNLLRPPRFIGLGNFFALLQDPIFKKSLKATILFACYAVPTNIVITFLIALALNGIVKLRGIFRTIYFTPATMSLAIVSLLWVFIYAYPKGIINQIFQLMGLSAQKWLTSPFLALPSLMIMILWVDIGYNVVLFIAGLQGIPNQFYEAAQIDGANNWQLFWNVTMPLLRPTLLFVIVMTSIWYFQVFAPMQIMTGGGPNYSTNVLSLYVYNNAFAYLKMGYASALSIILFTFIIALTLVYFKVLKQKWEY